jgi:transposase
LRWRDAPREYGPHKTIYNRFVRWSRLGVFNAAAVIFWL